MIKQENAWHTLAKEEVCTALETTPQGLPEDHAAQRLQHFGLNRLPQSKPCAWYMRLFGHINNALIYVMIAASVITFMMGHGVDSIVIGLVIVVNTIIGYIQEGKAEKAMDAIRDMMAPHASVMRGAKRMTLDADKIVPGDIVILEAGDRVPADLRLIQARALKIDEAALTGESVPAEKHETILAETTPLAERSNMAFSGTFVAAGQGIGIVTSTGADTELGRINAMLDTVETLKTPLLRQMDILAHRLTMIILGVAALLFVFAYYVRDYTLSDAFMTVVGFAVAVVPEGLPAVMTIALAIGVNRMARRNAIVRRLPAVETLGAVSVICTDKTGTLTRNEMVVGQVVTYDGLIDISGEGYSPDGGFDKNAAPLDPAQDQALRELALAALLCNDAQIQNMDTLWSVNGDPMEGALVSLALKAGYAMDDTRKAYPRMDEIPFDSAYCFMATLHHDHNGRSFMIVKGAPEKIIAMSNQAFSASGAQAIKADEWMTAIDDMAARGQRVLGLAIKEMPAGTNALNFEDAASGLTLLGLTGLIDPPRQEAIEAVAECRRAGIRVVMITGDHAATALAIARQLVLSDTPKVLSGKDLDGMSDEELHRIAREIDVFARANPAHKLRLVQALQADGDVIAMTGDGVNDAPALKQADVGVAMGRKGTEVAKESAEIVLGDDNFASIAAAVREGRTVYDNLRKVIAWTLPTNVGEVLAIVIALMCGLAIPLTPVQILWINMVTSVGLGLVLAFEPTEPGTMRRPPRKSNEALISRFMLWRILFVSSLFAASAFGLYNYALSKGLPLEGAHTMVVNVIVVLEIFYLFSVRYVHGTSLTLQGVLGTKPVLLGVSVITLAQFAFTYVPFMNMAFGTYPLAFTDGLLVVVTGVVFLFVVECEKRFWTWKK